MEKGQLVAASLAGMRVPCLVQEILEGGLIKVEIEGPTQIITATIHQNDLIEEEQHEAYDYADDRNESQIQYRNQYMKAVELADEKYPELEDRYCNRCGQPLVKGSMNYDEGFHFDGCE